jgi:RsiW-degrading membrane proteinase PrsW (M82 family)
MLALIALAAGILPMVGYALIVYWLDRYEREPLALVGALFFWGFIPSAVLALITQLIFEVPLMLMDASAFGNVVGAIVAAPITEEIFKGIGVLLVYLLLRYEFDDVFDGVVYGSLVGFGFAAIENVLYFLSGDTADLPVLIFMRAFMFGLNHALFTSLTGIGFGIARNTRSSFMRFLAPLAGLTAAITAHALHNLGVTLAESGGAGSLLCILSTLVNWGGILFIIILLIITLQRHRSYLVRFLAQEVQNGTLRADQYEVVCSLARRRRARMAALLSGNLTNWWRYEQFFSTCSKLAFRLYRLERLGGEALTQHVAALRNKTRALAQAITP